MHHMILDITPGWRPLAMIARAMALAGLAPDRHRRADTGGGVRLYRQLGNSASRDNDTWDGDRRGVWVDNGCRAEFTLDYHLSPCMTQAFK